MQKIRTGLLIVAVLHIPLIWYLALQSREELVYIDTNVLLEKYQGMKDARGEFQKKTTTWKANIDTLEQELKQAIFDYEKESGKLSEKERKLSVELLNTKQEQFENYQRAIQEQSRQEDMRMTETVLKEVNAQIEVFAREKGYRIIFGANGSGNIVYAQEGINITDEVVNMLNQRYQKF